MLAAVQTLENQAGSRETISLLINDCVEIVPGTKARYQFNVTSPRYLKIVEDVRTRAGTDRTKVQRREIVVEERFKCNWEAYNRCVASGALKEILDGNGIVWVSEHSYEVNDTTEAIRRDRFYGNKVLRLWQLNELDPFSRGSDGRV